MLFLQLKTQEKIKLKYEELAAIFSRQSVLTPNCIRNVSAQTQKILVQVLTLWSGSILA